MNRFSRMHLSPDEAMRNFDATDLGETSSIAEGIALIAVIDERRDYLAAGYSSMCNYCMGRRRWSEDKALRRIQVARAALRFPEMFEYLADGRLEVTTAAVLAPHLEPGTADELLAAAAHRPQREVVQMLAERSRPAVAPPVAAAGELLVEPTSCQHAALHAESHLNRCDCVEGNSTPVAPAPAPAPAKKPRRGRVSPAATGEYEVRLTITEEEHAEFVRAQALLGHAVPSGDPALVYARAMEHYVSHLEKQRLGAKPGSPVPAAGAERIPKALRRFIWERDGGRCTFVSADGHRCDETMRVQVDHITPLALGGRSTADNLRLLCAAHNQYEAKRVLTGERVQCRREIEQRERTRAKLAAQASAERQRAREAGAAAAAEAQAKGRDAARKARHDDVYAALRGLRSNPADARRGAGVADAMPDDASTAECLKAALTVLARPLLMRCKRMARCTT